MPIYDYVCSNCATRTEFIHGIDAASPRFCPACGAEGTLRKAWVTPAVHFKGSGWAKKDRSSGSAAKTKAGAGSSGGGKDGSSGDGKDGSSGDGKDRSSESAGGGASEGSSGGSKGSSSTPEASSGPKAPARPGEG